MVIAARSLRVTPLSTLGIISPFTWNQPFRRRGARIVSELRVILDDRSLSIGTT
jgi:hypothetical protein